jgi:tetratricopeptide (TPR) repeat protein
MALQGTTDIAERARQSASEGDWQGAFRLFMALDADGSLDSGDLPLLAEVAYAAGHLDVTITAWERVHAVCRAEGDPAAAAGAAARVAMHLLFDTALMGPVRGWLARAERLLEGRADCPAHAWHAVVRAYERLLSGDHVGARRWADRSVEVGSKLAPAAAAIGQVARARLLLIDGDVDAGLSLLHEVGVATMAGDLDPLSTGVVYCELVCALQGIAQYDLAEEWTEVMERWCQSHAIGSLHGRCRVHRAEILRLRGRCDEAEAEATTACEELRPYLRRELGWPLAELGQIRLRRGDAAGAERALSEALQVGWDAQPGLAAVQLSLGNATTAAEMIRDALDRPVQIPSKERPPNTGLQRAPLLAAQVEIEIADGEIERARSAAEELEQIADRFRSRALAATAALARGRVRLADGEAAEAREHFGEALKTWGEIGAPYELAETHRELGRAYLALGLEHQARIELEAARALFQAIAGSPNPAVANVHPSAAGADPLNRLVCEGDYWAITFAGSTVRVRDRKGIRYLARLVAEPDRDLHVLDLVAWERDGALDGGPAGARSVAIVEGDAGPMLDDQARDAYKRRLEEIDADLEEARALGDLGRASQAEAERTFLLRELSRAFGLGGRSRKARATSERARVAATRALRSAIERVSEHHGALGDHLDQAVRTGTHCSYRSEPDIARWHVLPCGSAPSA